MKSYLFTTDNDRGGVMLCDIDEFDEAVEYLCDRFDGVVRVEAGEQLWQQEEQSTVQEETAGSDEPEARSEPDLFA